MTTDRAYFTDLNAIGFFLAVMAVLIAYAAFADTDDDPPAEQADSSSSHGSSGNIVSDIQSHFQ